MSSLPTALIFTYPEYGQANVSLATSYELALAGVNVYIASFSSLGARVSRFQELIDRRASQSSGKPTGSVIFHECKGFSPWEEAFKKRGLTMPGLRHPHGVSGAVKGNSALSIMMYPWSQEEHLAAIESCKEIIAAIQPNIVVIDFMFYPAMDACELLQKKFMIIMPFSIMDVAARIQPYSAAFWKYPIISSGFPYPLKWWQIPLNIYLHIRLIISWTTSADTKKIRALHRSLGIKSILASQFRHGVPHICPALVETDFPLALIPDEMRLCGPIVIPFDTVEERDPALMKWLDNGPTVMINLGSHVVSDDKIAREVGGAIRILLDHHDTKGSSKLQVLWKAKASGDVDRVVRDMVGEEIQQARVKVVAWLDPEPVSVLQHPNVVCTVHHGGANSFFEAVWSGLPHIVLPVWLDTYQYASRVEALNIGIFGNQSCAPDVQAEEFGQALVRVTGDTQEAIMFNAAAKRLKELCRARGNGRELASLAILREMGLSK